MEPSGLETENSEEAAILVQVRNDAEPGQWGCRTRTHLRAFKSRTGKISCLIEWKEDEGEEETVEQARII